MSLPRNAVRTSSTPVFAGVALLMCISGTAWAGDANRMLPATSHCADFGPALVDMGNGTCGRPSSHVRVGTRNANASAWTTDGTSNAGLRSDAHGMMPGAGGATHLRVHSGLDPLSLFR